MLCGLCTAFPRASTASERLCVVRFDRAVPGYERSAGPTGELRVSKRGAADHRGEPSFWRGGSGNAGALGRSVPPGTEGHDQFPDAGDAGTEGPRHRGGSLRWRERGKAQPGPHEGGNPPAARQAARSLFSQPERWPPTSQGVAWKSRHGRLIWAPWYGVHRQRCCRFISQGPTAPSFMLRA